MSNMTNITETLETLRQLITSLPSTITIDSTLTQSGQAADAKSVGEAIAAISLDDLGIGVTVSELHQLLGVTSNIQMQLNGKAPAYSYGTTDLTAGTSILATGKLYFVYE